MYNINPLFRKSILTAHLALLCTRRFTSSMAATPNSSTLDRTLFNTTFYARIRTFWFEGVGPNATAFTLPALQRWYGVNSTDAQKAAFDDACRDLAESALQAIGPEKLALPPFESYEDEIANAATLAAPLLAEVQNAPHRDTDSSVDGVVDSSSSNDAAVPLNASPAALTLLSLLILLDQFPRNIHRTPPGLRLVYMHYDRLAFALFHSSTHLTPSPHSDPFFRARPVYATWLLMPLLHSEHLPSHALARSILSRWKAECEAVGDREAAETVMRQEGYYESHAEPLRMFGRYPHRNAFVGRRSTGEEEEYLETADTFGVMRGGE